MPSILVLYKAGIIVISSKNNLLHGKKISHFCVSQHPLTNSNCNTTIVYLQEVMLLVWLLVHKLLLDVGLIYLNCPV